MGNYNSKLFDAVAMGDFFQVEAVLSQIPLSEILEFRGVVRIFLQDMHDALLYF